MSLVGPRPHALSHDHDYERRISLYARRHNVKPGITGWAQINGYRGEIDSDEKIRKRVEYDLFYIDNWSLWLDLKIIARTLLSPRSIPQRLLSGLAVYPANVAMAATAPTVISAVDSHNSADEEPQWPRLFSHGRNAWLGPGLQRRLAQPQHGAGALDIGKFASKLLLLEPRQGRDILAIRRWHDGAAARRRCCGTPAASPA